MSRLAFTVFLFQACLLLLIASPSSAEDWRGFRGSDGSGISRGNASLPVSWSSTDNLSWSIQLPGPGSSSPIIIGERVLLTCYSGYDNTQGDITSLKRQLICLDRNSGTIQWQSAVTPSGSEDLFEGFITEHGYASSTPVSDGEIVVSFFGKAGVFAHDLQGKQLWHADVGQQSGTRRWGSSGSPVISGNVVIINASDESLSIRGLDKTTGKEIWKAEAQGLENTFCTPLLLSVDGHNELVVPVPGEIWGLNPATGKLLWYATTELDGNVCPSPVFQGKMIFAMGGRQGSTVALRAGGRDDVTNSHLAWSSQASSYVPSPVVHEGHLYWVSDRGIAHCLKVDSGEIVYQERLVSEGGFGGGRPFYASIVLADNKLYVVSRVAGVFVLAAGPKFKQLGQNQLDNDESQFNASPAISRGQIFLRSDTRLYCIENK